MKTKTSFEQTDRTSETALTVYLTRVRLYKIGLSCCNEIKAPQNYLGVNYLKMARLGRKRTLKNKELTIELHSN